MNLQHVTVIIPALNEEDSIGLVLADLPAVGRVIVVDNGSTDETALRARAAGARVVSETRRGYGVACLRGLDEVRRLAEQSESDRPSVIVFADADYSDHVHQLPQLVEPILNCEFDFVLGSRILGERERNAMPPQSLWGNRLACFLMRLTVGHRYTDLGPFRAIRYSSLEQLGMVDTNFGWTVEMQIKAALAKLRIKEIPAAYRCRIGASKISGTVSGTINAGSKILYLILRYAIALRFKDFPPSAQRSTLVSRGQVEANTPIGSNK